MGKIFWILLLLAFVFTFHRPRQMAWEAKEKLVGSRVTFTAKDRPAERAKKSQAEESSGIAVSQILQQLAAEKNKHDQTERQLREAKNRVDDFDPVVAQNLEDDLKSESDTLVLLEQQMKAAQGSQTRILNDIQQAKDQNDVNYREALSRLNIEITNREQLVRQLNDQMEAFKIAGVSTMNISEFSALNAQVRVENEQIGSLKFQAESLTNQWDQDKTRYQVQTDQNRMAFQQLQDSLQAQYDDTKSQKDSIQKQIQQNQQEIESADDAVQVLGAQYSEEQNKIAFLEKLFSEKEKGVSQLKS